VVENELNAYHGLLPVDSLLAEVSRLKIEYALESNPLTGLPGSLVLARVVESRLRGHDPFALGWVDIDYFKPFNDHYGFPRGDEVLLLLSELLRTRAGRAPTRFLAHPGGDDFAVLTAPEEAAGLGQAVALEFADRVLSLYDPADRRRGGITSVDRQGVPRHFGFLTLSIGIVAWQGELGMTYRRLVEIAAEMKGAAKRVPGTAVFANQRALQAAGHGQPAQ
jgi:diguanylate cyclase (GGDEF)-like protein